MCGDPECGNCFPRNDWPDEDAAYEVQRQLEIDDDVDDRHKRPQE